MKAGPKINIQPHVIAEIAKAQMGQMHTLRMTSNGSAGDFFLFRAEALWSDWHRHLPPRSNATHFVSVKVISFKANSGLEVALDSFDRRSH